MINLRKNNPIEIILLLVTLALLIALDFIYAKYALPLTEGWWELLAYIAKSKELYRDIYIGLPPLYINLISLLLYGSENIYYERILYIGVHLLEYLSLIKLIQYYQCKKIAILSAFIFEIILYANNVAYLSKDYHVFLQLIINIYLIVLINVNLTNYKIKNVLFGGLIAGLIVLTKQNIAMLIIFTAVLYLIWCKKYTKVFYYILGVFITLGFYSFFMGTNWVSVYTSNDSKGSVFTILTRFVHFKTIYYSLMYGALCYVYNNILIAKYKILSKYENIYLVFLVLILILLAINKHFDIIIAILIVEIVINVLYELKIIGNRSKFLDSAPISLTVLALVYANSLTASFNFVGCQVILALFIATALSKINNFNKNYFWYTSSLLIILLSFNIVNKKFDGDIYSWWGYSIGKISENNIPSNVDKLNGMMVNYDTNYVLESVNELRKNNVNSKFYIYPNIPILYYALDIPVLTKYPILWFDIVPSTIKKYIISEFNEISPDYIVWLRPPKYVYDGHYKLKKSDSVLSAIDSRVLELLEEGKYGIVKIHPMGMKNSRSSEVNAPIDITLICDLCSDKMLKKEMMYGNILKFTSMTGNNGANILVITFQNSFSYSKFLDENKPIVVNSDFPLFIVMRKK